MKAVRRFFIAHEETHKPSPRICGQEARHIKRVLRLQPGDRVLLVDGSGYEYEAALEDLSNDHVSVAILRRYLAKAESPLKITVAQGFLKEKKMDVLVRHLTELGISKWRAVFTEHALPRPDEKRLAERLKRWNTIAREAIKQCNRALPPEILPPLALQDAVYAEKDADLKLIFWEKESALLHHCLDPHTKRPSKVFILLGPEGGFSEAEISLAKSAGFISASLGPRILRAETAAISACALIQYLYGDMGQKTLDRE